MNVNVNIRKIEAEQLKKFTDYGKVQIATNLNCDNLKKIGDNQLILDFVFSINYQPNIGKITIKGKCEYAETEQEIHKNLREKKPNQEILQNISNVVFIDSIMLCRILNLPPALPLPTIKH